MYKKNSAHVLAKYPKMTIFENENGRRFIKLTPAGRGSKYCAELHEGKVITNGGVLTDKKLSKTQKAYRSGYVQSRSDNAKAYKSNLKKIKFIGS